MSAQCLEKWLKAAANKASQGRPVNLDVAHAGRSLYLRSWCRADEADLHSPEGRLLTHARHARKALGSSASVKLPIRYRAERIRWAAIERTRSVPTERIRRRIRIQSCDG